MWFDALRRACDMGLTSDAKTFSRHFTFAGTAVTHQHSIAVETWRKLRTMTLTIISKLDGGLHCTLYLTNQGEVFSFQVLLPNGRNVELCSKEGADEFVDTVGTDFISTNLTAAGDKELSLAYSLIYYVAENASPEKVASGIPESELRTFIEHMRNTLDTLSTDRNWLCSGTESVCHQTLLQAIACLSRNPSFLKIFISNEGMEAVAKLYASRKKYDTPSLKVAQLVLHLSNNSLCFLEQEEGVCQEKRLDIIEKTGLLGQFIRCVPVDPERSANVLTCLQTCLQLVKKKLKSGTRTGDILDAVIAGKDGPISEKAKSSLSRLQSLARLSNNNMTCTNFKMCHHCNKIEALDGAKLMKCQRCKVAYYCSKQCQTADWKIHKKNCKAISSSFVSPSTLKTAHTTNRAFVGSNYFNIAKEVYKKTQEYNVAKKELFVELDFYGDAPALRNEFKVWLVSGFFEGSSNSDAPDWFGAAVDATKKELVRHLREQYEKLTSDDLFVVSRASNGMVTFQSLRAPVANPGANADYEYHSDEAVESIGREDYIRMVACLGQHVTDEYFRKKRPGLT
jgi:hypothetical protein